MDTKTYKGFIINPLNCNGSVSYRRDGALVVDSNGIILFYGSSKEAEKKYPGSEVMDFSGSAIMPGFTDLHTHLPQLPAAGCGKGSLLEWLEKYIYPLEARFSDKDFAEKYSAAFFDELISLGTTTAVVYTSIHKSAADIAFQAAEKSGVRAYIGNSLMDANVPPALEYDVNKLLSESKALISKWQGHNNGRLQYVITPRYAGSCSFGLMKKCSEIAKSEELFIQTHLAENRDELDYISSLFPGHSSYTGIYQAAGLLTPKTILAHCIYLDHDELNMIKDSGAAIAHCPTSNRFLQSGVMPLRRYLDDNHRVGLGTDVAGGYSLSVINEMKEAIESSKTLNIMNRGGELNALSPEEAFCMATLGNAEILGIDKITGSLEKGKEANFIVMDIQKLLNENLFSENEELLRKIIYRQDKTNIKIVFVKGSDIYHK